MAYDALVVAPHPDDAETQMGGTLATLSDRGQRLLIVDLTEGEPTEFAERGVRAGQATEAARILGVDRVNLGLQDRFLTDTRDARLEVARLPRTTVTIPPAAPISAHSPMRPVWFARVSATPAMLVARAFRLAISAARRLPT